MEGALFVGFIFFCSFWAPGLFLQCSVCRSAISYDDCQKNITMETCAAGQLCYQGEVQLEKGSLKETEFAKSCLGTADCEKYNKGQLPTFCENAKNDGFTGTCKGKCCDEDNCNKGNLLASKASAFVMSVMVLLSGAVLTAVNVN